MYSYVLGIGKTIGEKIMRKGILYIAILGMVVALAGCGKGEELPQQTQQSDSTTIDGEVEYEDGTTETRFIDLY